MLLLYRTFGPSVNLCAFLQLQYLAETREIAFRHKRLLQVEKRDIDWADTVVFVRGDGLLDEWMARTAHRAGKYLIYITDDDLLHVPMDLGSRPYYAQRSVQRHIRRVMEYSDCFASPSRRLLEKYGSGRTFSIVEPAASCIEKKSPQNDGVVRIGFAGSSDRGRDIDTILSEALTEIVARYGDRVSLEFFGVQTRTADALGCRTYPYTESYESYQAAMKRLNWDIGLAPMPDTEFHACKHCNKLVEYCGFGIAGVYSALPPYVGAVEDGITGLLCENTTEAWVAALSRLIEDTPLRETISQNCLDRAQGIFSVSAAAEVMGQALAELELPAESRPVRGCFPLMKLCGLCSWYWEKFKKYGWRTPIVAVRKLRGQFRRSDT